MVMLAFAIMGVLAMGVDLGMAILTRSQMQAAVDTAALEGLRQRDAKRDDVFAERDLARREAASQIAALVYDADGQLAEELTDGGETDTFGAQLNISKPRLIGSGSPGALRRGASGRSPQIEGSRNYKPTLQLNVENALHGDLVHGYYVGDDDPELFPKEGKRYWRTDFQPTEAISESFGDPSSADAFLARMRRTNDFLGLDNIRGVSSSGPPLPLIFGNGGTLPMGNPAREYSYRFHGITVRATAIAQAQPVLTIGAPVLPDMFSRDKAVLGMAGFVLTEKFLRTFEGRGKVRLSNSKLKVKTGDGPAGRERKIGWFVTPGKGLAVGEKIRVHP